MSQTSTETIPPQLIEDALERILSSRAFRGSARKRRFLQFIVQKTQAGQANQIKAYTIAIDVFDRDASFDPLADPVVRIEGGRLRRCLENYYLTEGAADLIQITIPKGGYVPCFIVNQKPAAAGLLEDLGNGGRRNAAKEIDEHTPEMPAEAPVSSPPPLPPPRLALLGAMPLRTAAAAAVIAAISALLLIAVWGVLFMPLPEMESERTAAARVPSLMVRPFTNGSGDLAQDLFAEGFTEDLIGALVRFQNLQVFGADTCFRYRSEPEMRDAEPAPDIDYVLKGSISQAGDQIQINVALIHATNRRYIWSDTVRRDVGSINILALRQDIAIQVARALAQPHGVIDKEEARTAGMSSPGIPSSSECML